MEETAEGDAAKQLRSMREAMNNGPIDCILKVRKYAEMLERYEKHSHGHSMTMKLEALRQLLMDTVMEINRLKVILLNPNTFAIAAAARAAPAATAAITSTEELTHSRLREAVGRSRPLLTRDLRGLGTVDSSDDARPTGRGRGGGR